MWTWRRTSLRTASFFIRPTRFTTASRSRYELNDSLAEAGAATIWAGVDRLRGLSSRFTAITPVGATVTCEGRIAERFEQDGAPMLRVALTATIDDGTQTLRGEALISAA